MNNFLDKLRPLIIDRVKNIKEQDFNINESSIHDIDFLDIFKQKQPVIIAEIKFASPSSGIIYKGNLDPIAIAGSYLKNGASAISVLAEPHYFKGNIEYIRDIRNAYPHCNILLKDFVLDEKQIIQGKKYGANAVLLIAAFLKPNELKRLYDFALDLNIASFIEVNNIEELNYTLELNPKLIGINNRNLKSLNIDLATSRSMINQIPDSTYVICASGIYQSKDIKEMIALGFDGFLIGSSLMESEDPGLALKKLLAGITK